MEGIGVMIQLVSESSGTLLLDAMTMKTIGEAITTKSIHAGLICSGMNGQRTVSAIIQARLIKKIIALSAKHGYCTATDRYLAEDLICDERSTRDALAVLERANLITRNGKRGRSRQIVANYVELALRLNRILGTTPTTSDGKPNQSRQIVQNLTKLELCLNRILGTTPTTPTTPTAPTTSTTPTTPTVLQPQAGWSQAELQDGNELLQSRVKYHKKALEIAVEKCLKFDDLKGIIEYYDANRHLFTDGGAIVSRLKHGVWPEPIDPVRTKTSKDIATIEHDIRCQVRRELIEEGFPKTAFADEADARVNTRMARLKERHNAVA